FQAAVPSNDAAPARGRAHLQRRRPAGGDDRRGEPHRHADGDRRPRLRRHRRDSRGPHRQRTRRPESARFADGRADRPNRRRRAAREMKTFRLFVPALALAAACAPATKYAAPSAPIAPAFKENADWKTPEPRDADIRGTWWEIFGDPQLSD